MNANPNGVLGHTVGTLVDENVQSIGDLPQFIEPIAGTSLSYAECGSIIARIANNIATHGVEPGQPVAFAFSNSVDGALAVLGIMYGNFLATAINLVSGENTIEYVLDHSEAKLVIIDSSAENLVRPIASRSKNPITVITLDQLFIMDSVGAAASKPNSNDPALLMYTSGTTGKPKGVVHTHESVICGGRNAVEAHELSVGDRGLCVLPLYHINAFCVSLMGSLVSGGSLVIPSGFSVSNFWQMISKHECTWFSVVPTQISYLLHRTQRSDDDLGGSKLRFGRSASAPLSPEMHAAFEERFRVPLIETMGLTETAAQILSNPLPPEIRKIGSPGIPYGNEVIIADGNQQELGRGVEGEILVRGPNVLKEYLKNPDATASSITADRWLKTGDLGKMDEDGYVFVTGRLKELIIKGGENIAPREIDEVLYGHPAVIEAAAFGVKCDNYGERVEAGVKLATAGSVSDTELVKLCKEKLGDFKSPDRVHILDQLPKGPSGKIQRIKLAEMVSGSSNI